MLVGYLPFDDRNMVVLYQKVAIIHAIKSDVRLNTATL
jgi:hypothetical protein